MRSLNTRITFYSLAIFVASLWTLTFYTSAMLREDIQQELGEQQFSTVTLVAEEIDQELNRRFFALERIATQLGATGLQRQASVQDLLASNPLFLDLFNGGAFVTDADGTAIASLPVSAQRLGINYIDRDHVFTALREGQSTTSAPVIGKALKVPVVSMAAPVRDAKNKIVGALVGVTTLSKNNFLDRVIGHRYGESGGFVLIDAKYRRIVSATDKRHVLQPLQEPGKRPLNDRYVAGFEGFGVDTDAEGVEYLSAAHRIPASHWYAVALLPTAEAFAPIRRMQLRMFYAASLLTLLAGGLMWWLMRRELAPLHATARTLTSLHKEADFPQALHNTRSDEIGQLIDAFNRLLETLRKRDSALQESEDRFRTLVEWTPQAIAVHSAGKFVYANPAALRILEATRPEDVVGQAVMRFVHPSQQANASMRARDAVIPGTVMPAIAYDLVTCKDRVIQVEGAGIAIQYNGQAASQIAFADVTERKAVERSLRQLSRITEQAPLAIVITKLNGEIEYVNPKFEEVTGFSSAELLGANPRVLQSGKTAAAVYADCWQTLRAGRVWRGEFINRRKNGEVFVEQATLAPVTGPDGTVTHYVGIKVDVTQDKQRQHTLEALMQSQKAMLDEKTALLNEVHHRVKNNLQVITSLLRLEEARTPQPHTQAVLQDMQGRIRSMALVHETLYRTGTFAAVDLHTYIRQVASNAFRAQAVQQGNIVMALDLDPLTVGIDLATPFGLLVNELVSNALKHAFPQGQAGEITVALKPVRSAQATLRDAWCLSVSDNGCGLPENFAARRQQSLGLQLVSDLAKQLKGELQIHSAGGTRFALNFHA